MQVSIMVALFLSSDAAGAGLEQMLNIAEFIAGIYQQLPSSCIVITNSEAQQQGFGAAVLMRQIRKYFLYEYIPITEKAFGSGTRESCVAQRAIYVILSGNEETRSYITQTFMVAYSSGDVWLLFLDTNTSLDQFFTGINIPFDCQFLLAQPQRDHVVVLTEVYRVSPTLTLQTHRFGNWTAGGGLTWPTQGLYRRRNNLQGHVIRAAHVNAESFLVRAYYEEIWVTVADSINLTTVFHEADSFGSKSPNGSWNGMMALVSSGVADIGVGDFFLTKERFEVVAFTYTLGIDTHNVYIRLPNNSALTWNRYIAPFSYGLWLAVAIAACAVSVCLALTTCGNGRTQGLAVPAVFFYIHACFCKQGQPDEVKSTSGRTVILTSHVTSLVLLAAYSAFLISSLAVQPREPPFRNLQELVCDGSYKLGVFENTFIFNVFARATEGVDRIAYKELIAPFKKDFPISYLDGFRRICADHNYAYVATKFSAKFVSWLESCQLVTLPETSYPVSVAFIISKNCPYKGFINWRLAQLRERGIQSRILQPCVPSKEPSEQPSTIDVSMATVAPILVVLAAGYVIGIVILLIERCVRGNIFKYWPRESVRKHPKNEY